MEPNRVIPIFPLPLVQFPGAVTPLHIFEPRYRQMTRDALADDRSIAMALPQRPGVAEPVPRGRPQGPLELAARPKVR